MNTLKRVLVFIAVMLAISVSNAYADNKEYIKTLDITVVEYNEGAVGILQIGRYSPFRRYSWFRIGDIIETVDGVKTTVYVLNSLQKNQDPYIKYKRGVDIPAERQISLEMSVYDRPPYLNSE